MRGTTPVLRDRCAFPAGIACPRRGQFDSITRYLCWDNDRLDGLLGEVTRRVETGHFGAASCLFAAFDEGLRHHMRIEEEILFPLFEARTGLPNGPTATMRAEHIVIAAELVRMRLALQSVDVSGYAAGLEQLHELLSQHGDKEEQVLYPATDDILSPAERQAFLDRLAHS
jgi:iron-sulfur cluster repair protein YtfE (RIC family)